MNEPKRRSAKKPDEPKSEVPSIEELSRRLMALEESMRALAEGLRAYQDEVRRTTLIMSDFDDRINRVEELVGGRNKSAPVKRNMTDDDARRVMTDPEIAKLDHKEAAAAVGLTYAQVYSCRKTFTFKHIHKELRDSGWKNPWKN